MEKFEPTIEEGKSPEEILIEQSRRTYADAYSDYRKAFGGMKEKKLAGFEKTIEPSRKYIELGDSEKLKSGEESAVERKYNFVKELMERGLYESQADAIYITELKKAEYEAAKVEIGKKMIEQGASKAEIFQKLVLQERELLNQAKVESWPPVEKGIFRKGMEWWMQRGTATRLLISTGLVTGVVAAFGGFGATAAATYASYRFIRGFGSVVLAKLAGKGVDIVLSKGIIAKKEAAVSQLREGFDLGKLKEVEKELEKVFEETAKKERRKLLLKAGITVAAGVGASLGLGMLGQAWVGGPKVMPIEGEQTAQEGEITIWGTREGFVYKTPEGRWSEEGYKTIAEAQKAREEAFAALSSKPPIAQAEELPPVKTAEAGISPEQLELATIKKPGEGVWHAVYRQLQAQLENNPAKFDLKPEDLNDAAKIKEALNKETMRILMENKIIKPDGTEIWIRDIGTKVILKPDNTIEITGGKTYEWQPSKLTERELEKLPVKGPRDIIKELEFLKELETQEKTLLPQRIEIEAEVDPELVSETAYRFHKMLEVLDGEDYFKKMSLFDQERALALASHSASQLDQWGIKPTLGGSYPAQLEAVLKASEINELMEGNRELYNQLTKAISAGTNMEWDSIAKMKIGDMMSWAEESQADFKPGAWRLIETVSEFKPTYSEQGLNFDQFLQNRIRGGESGIAKFFSGVPEEISASKPMAEPSEPFPEKTSLPETAEVEPEEEVAPQKEVMAERISPLTEPKTIKIEGGEARFQYDASGNPIKMASSFELKGVTGGEYFSGDFRKSAVDWAIGQKTDPQLTIDKLSLAGRQISGYLKFYEQLKSGGYAKEADFVLNAIKKILGEIDKTYGKGIVDYEKLPDYLKK